MQGDKFSKVVKPIMNTMQNLTDQIETKVNFSLGGDTKITISKISANTKITFYLSPEKVAVVHAKKKTFFQRLKFW